MAAQRTDEPPTVAVDSIGSVYARIFGAVDTNMDFKAMSINMSDPITHYITTLPFTIGRAKPESMKDAEFLAIDNSRISREHAVIDWDKSRGHYTIKCKSKNGIDVNRKHIEMNETSPLPSQSAVRMGQFYFYFCLPKGHSKPAAEEPAKRTRNSYNIKGLLDQAYEKHFATLGYASMTDFLRTLREMAEPGALPESDDHLRKAINTVIKKPNSGWQSIEAEAVPKDVYKELCSRHARKPTMWFGRTDAIASSGLHTAASSGLPTASSGGPVASAARDGVEDADDPMDGSYNATV